MLLAVNQGMSAGWGPSDIQTNAKLGMFRPEL